LFKNPKIIFYIVDELPLWSDADDSLRSMSDPEDDEAPKDKDSQHAGVGDGDGETCKDKGASDKFFDAGKGAVISDRLSLHAASESGQRDCGTTIS
jgi:hypothetical protein